MVALNPRSELLSDRSVATMELEAYANIFKIEENLWWYRGRRYVCFPLLEKYLPQKSELDVLDVGCGTGYNLKLLERYGKAQGVDMSPEALRFCQERGVTNVKLHEAEVLPFEDESFDLVTAFDVIEHIEDDRQALGECYRLLKPGGWCLIYTPALPWMYNDHDRKVHHKRRYVRSELGEKMLAAGFELHHLSYVNLFILPVVLLARLLLALRPREHAEMEVPPEPFNWFFSKLCLLESYFVNSVGLPYGMTLVALGRRR